jgi:hypothetical protein
VEDSDLWNNPHIDEKAHIGEMITRDDSGDAAVDENGETDVDNGEEILDVEESEVGSSVEETRSLISLSATLVDAAEQSGVGMNEPVTEVGSAAAPAGPEVVEPNHTSLCELPRDVESLDSPPQYISKATLVHEFMEMYSADRNGMSAGGIKVSKDRLLRIRQLAKMSKEEAVAGCVYLGKDILRLGCSIGMCFKNSDGIPTIYLARVQAIHRKTPKGRFLPVLRPLRFSDVDANDSIIVRCSYYKKRTDGNYDYGVAKGTEDDDAFYPRTCILGLCEMKSNDDGSYTVQERGEGLTSFDDLVAGIVAKKEAAAAPKRKPTTSTERSVATKRKRLEEYATYNETLHRPYKNRARRVNPI